VSDRYTSPETSKLLAEAFTDRDSRDFSSSGAWWRHLNLKPPTLVTGTVERPRTFEWDTAGADMHAVRALDLTDVLHEMTRPRPEEKDARPLCETWFLYPSWVLTIGEEDGGVRKYILPWRLEGYEFSVGDHGKPTSRQALADSPVEAAALVLLAILKERKP